MWLCAPCLLLLQEDLINEINIMKQCQSEYIVSYFGSYFKDNDLWVPDARSPFPDYCAASCGTNS